MKLHAHQTSRGFYRPDAYFGLWAIAPQPLTQYLAIVNRLDLTAMAAAALKADASPRAPLPTEKPDLPTQGKKKPNPAKAAKKADLDEKKGKHDTLGKDIADHQDKLDEQKKTKSETDQADIEKSESELDGKKADHKKLADEIEAGQAEHDALPEEVDDSEDAEPEVCQTCGKQPCVCSKAAAGQITPLVAGQPVNGLGAGQSFEGYQLDGDTAIIEMSGPITKYPSSFQAVLGGCSTVQTQYAIRQANLDSSVARIAIRIDSPGGTAAGMTELMSEVAASGKPVWVYGADQMCSGGYFAAVGAKFIACNPTAMVGSVGVLTLLSDTSGACEQKGIKVIAVGTGEHKGTCADGTPITAEQQAYVKTLVDDTFAPLAASVQGARKFTAEQWTDISKAGVFIGEKAVTVGLVDGVMTWDAFLSKFASDTDPAKLAAANEAALKLKVETENVARLDGMIAGGIPTALAVSLWKSGKSINEAKSVHAQQIIAADTLRAASGISAADGQPALNLGSKTTQDVQAEFMAAVEKHQAEMKCDRRTAMSAIITRNPKLYEEYQATFKVIEPPSSQSKK